MTNSPNQNQRSKPEDNYYFKYLESVKGKAPSNSGSSNPYEEILKKNPPKKPEDNYYYQYLQNKKSQESDKKDIQLPDLVPSQDKPIVPEGDNADGDIIDTIKESSLTGLQKLADIVDYPANVSRSAIKGYTEGGLDRALEYGKQAVYKDRETSPREIKEILGERLTGKKVPEMNFETGRFDAGDVVDFGGDFATDLATDPLTYLTAGLSSLAKIAKGGKAVKAAKAAKTAQRVDTATGATLGGAYGLGAAPDDASFKERLLYGAGGAAVGGSIGHGGPGKYVTSKLSKLADSAVDIVQKDLAKNYGVAKEGIHQTQVKATGVRQGRHQALEGLSDSEKIATTEIMETLKTDFVKAREQFLEENHGLLKNQHETHQQYMDWLKVKNPGTRIKKLEKELKLGDEAIELGLDEASELALKRKFVEYRKEIDFLRKSRDYRFVDRVKKNYRDLDKKWNEAFKEASIHAEKFVESNSYLKVLEEADFFVKEAVKKWEDHNARVVKDYNDMVAARTVQEEMSKAMQKQASGQKVDLEKVRQQALAKAGEKELVGIRWHTPDVYPQNPILTVDKMFQEAKEIKQLGPKKLHAARSKERSDSASVLADYFMQKGYKSDAAKAKALDEIYAKYADNFAKTFLTAEQRTAQKNVKKYFDRMESNSFGKILAGYDKLNSFNKKLMLGASLLWHKNQLWDNLFKSYVESGFMGIPKYANEMTKTLPLIQTDIKKIINNQDALFKDPLTMDAIKYKVIDNTNFKEFADDHVKVYLRGEQGLLDVPKTGEEAVGKLKYLSGLKKGLKPFDMALNQSMKAGQLMENASRFATWKHIRNAHMKAGMDADDAAKTAAEVVKRAYFDYGDIHYFEKAVLKRIIPFYTFTSRNMPYWAKVAFDPDRARKMLDIMRARDLIGEDPKGDDHLFMPKYVAENNPRMFDDDEQGNKVYLTSPSMSLDEAAKGISALFTNLDHFLQQVSPMIKGPIEIITDEDFFTGGTLFPSTQQYESRGKNLYSRGATYYQAQEKANQAWNIVKDELKEWGITNKDIQNFALDAGIELDPVTKDPIAHKDFPVLAIKIFESFVPLGILNSVMGGIHKRATGKTTYRESAIPLTTPFQLIKQSPLQQSGEVQRKLNKVNQRILKQVGEESRLDKLLNQEDEEE